MKTKRIFYLAIVATVLSGARHLAAAEVEVDINVPVINTAEYHRPYVAIWLEDANRRTILNLALWLEKEKWHRDLRSWWRRGGSKLALPVDGVSGATRKPGTYTVSGKPRLTSGRYVLNVESVREVGGREHLRFPFDWEGKKIQLQQEGTSELGPATVTINPE